MTWARRLKRVFNINVETRRECGGAVKVCLYRRPGGDPARKSYRNGYRHRKEPGFPPMRE